MIQFLKKLLKNLKDKKKRQLNHSVAAFFVYLVKDLFR